MANYIMDQYRYTGTDGTCTQLINTYPTADPDNSESKNLKPVYRKADALISGKEGYYQDVLIPLTGETISEEDVFYVKMSVTRSAIDETTYLLKLVSSEEYKKKNEFLNYETLARFTVPKYEGTSLDPVRVILYAYDGEMNSTKYVGILNNEKVNANVGSITTTDEILYVNNNGNITSTAKDGAATPISHYTAIDLLPSWISNISEDDAVFDFESFVSSRYNEEVFDSLLLEIERNTSDKDVYNGEVKVKGETVNCIGRYLNVTNSEANQLDVEVYQINKLLPAQGRIIKKIGVWGRPGMSMLINGEEIKIGPSGIFEFEGIDITSFGVFANGSDDKFIVDYQYVNSE